ncbi:WG repeat-containing protein [Moraxella cuniculi]|nr:WG repeat-containing protein [Moraxella cuniculi]
MPFYFDMKDGIINPFLQWNQKMIRPFLKKVSYLVAMLLPFLFSQNSHANPCKRPSNKHELDYISCPSEGFSRAEKGNKAGFVDLSGNLVIPLIYDNVNLFSDGLAEVEKDGKIFFINHQGNIVIEIPDGVEVISEFKEGFVVIKQSSKIGFMDKTGKIIIDFQYDNASDFREGLAIVEKNNKSGFIDKTGTLVIPFNYDETSKFFNGVASVRIGNRWGAINNKGELIIPMIYDFISYFKDGEITDAQLNGEWIKIDKQGKPIKENLEFKESDKGVRHQKILEILNKNNEF